VRAAFDWLARQPGGCRAILGTRLGAILATQLHAQAARSDIALILWQPVVDGKTHLTQFLRVRMAAQLDRADLPKESTASMRKQLDAGESVEVAGYEIHPQLANAIDDIRLTDHVPSKGAPVAWFENAAPDEAQLSLPSKKVLDAWAAAGAAVDTATYAGPAFWQVHERVVTPSIIEQTSEWFRTRVARHE
jgi:exosortase A-associated hydrolase 2